MNILVTGGMGFIGSVVCRRLLFDGHAVVNLDALTYAANPRALAEYANHPAYRFVQADIADAGALRAVFAAHRPDAVLHLAAESHVDRSIDAPAGFVRTNIQGVFTLLQETRRHWESLPATARDAFRFVHVSTDEVFGDLADDDPPFDARSPYAPNSPYAASKAAGDHLVRAWTRTYGLPCLLSHSVNNYGPGQYPEKLIPLMMDNALAGRPLPIYGDGRNRRDWLHVDDHADGLGRLLAGGAPGERYFFAGHCELRALEVAERICDLADELVPLASGVSRRALIRFVPDRPGHDRRYAVDDNDTRARLDWRPQTAFDVGLRRTMQWRIAHPDWWAGRGD